MPRDKFINEMQGKFRSHVQIASNMGFNNNWGIK